MTSYVSSWTADRGLKLAAEKREIVLLTNRHLSNILPIHIGEETVQSKGAIKNLGMMLDARLVFWEVKRAADKSATVTVAYTSGPKTYKRRLLMSVTHSLLLYGSAIWADGLKI